MNISDRCPDVTFCRQRLRVSGCSPFRTHFVVRVMLILGDFAMDVRCGVAVEILGDLVMDGIFLLSL